MKIAFSTLACPGWSLEQAVEAGRRYGYDGIELRLLDGEVIPPGLAPEQRRRIRAVCGDGGLEIAALDSSIRLAGPDSEAIEADLRAFLELARELEAPLVRVFGGEAPAGTPAGEASAQVVRILEETARDAERLGVAIALETHDAYSSATAVADVLDRVGSPRAGALWDTHHPYRMGDSPERVLELLGSRLLHVHIKDARRQDAGWQLVLLGEGEVPVRESLEAIQEAGYSGWIAVEWEKKWHPEIADPEVALPQHLQLLREWLQPAGTSTNA